MNLLAAATALAVAAAGFVVPGQAQAQNSKDQTTTHKVKKAKVQNRVTRNGSPYSTNPAHDVYVNGNYVGSDPDARIRWSLKKEYCQDSIDGC